MKKDKTSLNKWQRKYFFEYNEYINLTCASFVNLIGENNVNFIIDEYKKGGCDYALDLLCDSLDKDESDSEDIVSTESLSDVKNSLLDFFFVDDLPEISSFNEWLLVKIEKQKDYMLIEWTK